MYLLIKEIQKIHQASVCISEGWNVEKTKRKKNLGEVGQGTFATLIVRLTSRDPGLVRQGKDTQLVLIGGQGALD